ncbi:MAG TPA: hypothetical protein VMD09_05790 [Solirubrobacteraceae bacterium]|nr:hypothetical protein [Solirubrobacteraceae bacterium]
MATLREKIAAEQSARAMLDDHGLPQPDEVEYGYTCIRLLWHEEKACMIVQIDEPPPGWVFAEDLPPEALPNKVRLDDNDDDDDDAYDDAY